jgi:hypothetical protein
LARRWILLEGPGQVVGHLDLARLDVRLDPDPDAIPDPDAGGFLDLLAEPNIGPPAVHRDRTGWSRVLPAPALDPAITAGSKERGCAQAHSRMPIASAGLDRSAYLAGSMMAVIPSAVTPPSSATPASGGT